MYLTQLRLRNVGPFDDVTLPFTDDAGDPRKVTVIFGESGVGKTTLLGAIAHTRPGLVATPPRAREGGGSVIARYRLGADDPARPHDLVVASPGADLGESATEAAIRKREQQHFDKQAEAKGFCVIPLSAARWASRVAAMGAGPDRPLSAMEHRTHATFDDAAKADLAREVKQALVNAVTTAALRAFQPNARGEPERKNLDETYRQTLAALLADGDATFEGVDPATFEPLFRDPGGRVVTFDELPYSAKGRVLLGAILLRRLSIAHPQLDPLECEGIALIDAIELHLPLTRQREIVGVLRAAFPRLQLILTTQSPLVVEACAHDERVVLSRDLETGRLAITHGPSTVLH